MPCRAPSRGAAETLSLALRPEVRSVPGHMLAPSGVVLQNQYCFKVKSPHESTQSKLFRRHTLTRPARSSTTFVHVIDGTALIRSPRASARYTGVL
jgi:hypothetical protein